MSRFGAPITHFQALVCRGDSPSKGDSLWQLCDGFSGALEARTAFSGHRQLADAPLNVGLADDLSSTSPVAAPWRLSAEIATPPPCG